MDTCLVVSITPPTKDKTKSSTRVYKELDNFPFVKDTTPNTGGSMYLTNQGDNDVLRKINDLPCEPSGNIVIADHKSYTKILDIPNWNNNYKVSTILLKSHRFNFNLGINDGTLYECCFRWTANDKKTKISKRGTSNKQWDRQFYPLYYINHQYAGLYVSYKILKMKIYWNLKCNTLACY